jgi:hypothetical protein
LHTWLLHKSPSVGEDGENLEFHTHQGSSKKRWWLALPCSKKEKEKREKWGLSSHRLLLSSRLTIYTNYLRVYGLSLVDPLSVQPSNRCSNFKAPSTCCR